MKPALVPTLLLATALHAQGIAIFPGEYANVPEGPFNSPNLPLANGIGRVLVAYDSRDLPIPSGASIRRLGFRQDATLTVIDPGQSLQLEVRMGYTTNSATSLNGTFANNYATTPVTVFGPALQVLPPLRDPANPLPNGQLWINLTTPFPYDPTLGNLLVEYRILGNTASGNSFLYRLDRADYYSPIVVGPAGCSPGANTPLIELQPARVGTSFQSLLTRAPANSVMALVLGVGFQLQTPYSLQPMLPGIPAACMGQISLQNPVSLVGFTNSSGSILQQFAIPNNQLYNDVYISAQAAIFDFFAPGGAVVSNGAQVQIGILPRSSMVTALGPPGSVTMGSVGGSYCPVAFFEYQ